MCCQKDSNLLTQDITDNLKMTHFSLFLQEGWAPDCQHSFPIVNMLLLIKRCLAAL